MPWHHNTTKHTNQTHVKYRHLMALGYVGTLKNCRGSNRAKVIGKIPALNRFIMIRITEA